MKTTDKEELNLVTLARQYSGEERLLWPDGPVNSLSFEDAMKKLLTTPPPKKKAPDSGK